MRFRKHVAELLCVLTVAFTLLLPSPKALAAPKQHTVEDALAVIYKNSSDVLARDYNNQAGSILLKNIYRDLLAGAYSKNAVACFLDHGLFTGKYEKLKDAGVLPDDYVLPDAPYTITRTDQQLRFNEDGDPVTRYVLVTDSIYLQTYQLLQISEIHAFDQAQDYEAELESYDDTYVYRVNSNELLEKAAEEASDKAQEEAKEAAKEQETDSSDPVPAEEASGEAGTEEAETK